MSFFITEKNTEKWLALQERKLPMPDGTVRSFSGFRLMWEAMDFLILIGNWSRVELVELAIQSSENPDFIISGRMPKGHNQPRPASVLQIKMLERHRLDPLPVTAESVMTIDQYFHNVVAVLYGDIQNQLGS